MPDYSTIITVNGEKHKTLKDILPKKKTPLKILFIAKTPALKSVEIGHYFQGQQGKFFWSQLSEYGILEFRPNTFEDENLLENNCGFTDIVKIPRNYGNEPTREEYQAGLGKILNTINDYQPKVIVFVYKAVLDKILDFGFGIKEKSKYGLNSSLKDLFNSEVFVFPMTATPCSKETRLEAMDDLKKMVSGKRVVGKTVKQSHDMGVRGFSKGKEAEFIDSIFSQTGGSNSAGCCRWLLIIVLLYHFYSYLTSDT